MIDEVGDRTVKNNKRHPLVVGCLLLSIAAIPDTMVVPVLHDLCVVRFGVTEGVAHAFMAVNLVGAVLAVFLLTALRRRVPSSLLLIGAAVLSSILMVAMVFAPTWWMFLTFRCFEGAADLLLLAIPFRMIAACGEKTRYGGRIGIGFTVMFLALGLGAGLGSFIGRDDAVNVLWAGAGTCAILSLIAVIVRRTVDYATASPPVESGKCPLIPSEWIGALFLGLDRSVAALVTVTLPLLLRSGFDVKPTTLGIAIGGSLLVLAAFSTPAGILADRFGGKRVRLIAASMCGLGLCGLGLMSVLPPGVILVPCLLVYGAGAAGLMPSVFSSCVRREASTLVFSSLQAAGQFGYAAGIVASGIIVSVIALPAKSMLSVIFPIAGIAFLCANMLLVWLLHVVTTKYADQ